MAARNIKSREQLAVVVERIGKRLRAIANRKQRLESRIARNKERVSRDQKELSRLTRIDEAFVLDQAAAVFAYAEAHRDELVEPGTATGSVDVGTISWYRGGKGRLMGDDQAIIAELLALLAAGKITQDDFDEVVKTERSVKKNPLKERADIIAQLSVAYIARDVFFSIRPDNAPISFSRPVEFLYTEAVERGLLSSDPEPATES